MKGRSVASVLTGPEAAALRSTRSRKKVYKPQFTKVDREFLPAALEILETPESPVGLVIILAICGCAAAALAWSYFGQVDILAIAQGKLQPSGRVKTVQALETSRILVIGAQNGTHVEAGDVLAKLDPREARADETAASLDLASHAAEVLRRRAAVEAAWRGMTASAPVIDWPETIPAEVRLSEEQVLKSDLAQLSAQVGSLKAQADQKRAELARLRATVREESVLVETLQQRAAMRSTLISKGADSKANLLDAIGNVQRGKAELARDTGEIAEAEANLTVIGQDIQKDVNTFIADNAQKLSEAERQVGTLREKLARAKVRSETTTLTSPISGVVQASALTTVGQVVTPGEELMRIVPDGTPLEVECYLPNREIGFVQDGQAAMVKVEAFPYTRYGLLKAEVVRIGRDAIPAPEAQQTEENIGRQRGESLSGGAQRVQNLVFPVTLRLDASTLRVDGADVPLQAGMAVSAEIRTGSRRILSYVLSPLTEVGSEAFRER